MNLTSVSMLQSFLKHVKWPTPGCHLLGTETAAIMRVKLPDYTIDILIIIGSFTNRLITHAVLIPFNKHSKKVLSVLERRRLDESLNRAMETACFTA